MAIAHVWCFGDSTSDNGVAHRLTRELLSRPGAPAEAYVLAGAPAYPDGRFTNGLTAVEVLAAELGAALDDFAVGGALSGYGNYYAWLDAFASTGLLAQVDAFVAARTRAGADTGDGPAAADAGDGCEAPAPDAGDLFVVQLAGNDYYAWMELHAGEPASAGDVARAMAANECEAVRRLVAAGARRLLVIGPKLASVCPWEVAAGRTGVAGGFTYALNELLPAELDRLQAELGDGVRVVFFDLVRAWRRLRVAASSYGLTELDRPYVRTSPAFVPGSGDPDTYFFWDESHVTAAVHRVLGEHLAASLPREWTGSAADLSPAP